MSAEGPGVTRVLLVRHGESEWNAAGRWQGWADTELTGLGILQAGDAAERLRSAGITTVVASDLRRTQHTAEIIAARLGLSPVHADPALREFDVGDWSGLTRPEIEARWPGQLDAWREGKLACTPGGEPRDHFVDRVLGAVRGVAHRFPGQTILAVTHGGVIGTLQRTLDGDDSRDRIGNLAGRWVDVAPDGEALILGRLERLLDPDESTLSPSR